MRPYRIGIGLLASDATPAQYRETRKFVKLPAFKPDLARQLAQQRNIPIAPTERSTGQAAVSISSPTNGGTVQGRVRVVGAVNAPGTKSWTLQVGRGSNPAEWQTVGSGGSTIDGVLGEFDANALEAGVYTIRVTVETASSGNLGTSVTVNVRKGSVTPTAGTGTVTPGGGGPGQTPVPTHTPRTQVPDVLPNGQD